MNFGSLFSFIIDIICVFECFCSLLGFMSDDYSFVVAFVDYLFKLDIYLYISLYIQAEYRRFGVLIFIVLFPVPVKGH